MHVYGIWVECLLLVSEMNCFNILIKILYTDEFEVHFLHHQASTNQLLVSVYLLTTILFNNKFIIMHIDYHLKESYTS